MINCGNKTTQSQSMKYYERFGYFETDDYPIDAHCSKYQRVSWFGIPIELTSENWTLVVFL